MKQVYESLKEAQQQQAERSQRISEIQRHLDETTRGHGNWLETHISVFLNESHMTGSSKEAGDSDNGRPQSSKGGWSKPNTAGQTPLSWAATSGQAVVAKQLLERGADMEAKDDDGYTPISLAASNGHWVVVKLLGKRGARIERKDDGHEAVASLIAESSAHFGMEYNDGSTPVLGAAFSGHEMAVSLWAERAASRKTNGNDGRTPISRAVLRLLHLRRH